MKRKNQHKVWSIDIEDLKMAVKNNESLRSVLIHFNIYGDGRNTHVLKERLNRDGIDFSHIQLGKNCNANRKFFQHRKDVSVWLTENSQVSKWDLKKRLLRDGLLRNECYICGLGNTWQNKKISLQLDHINGINNDNRLENLRILCPNCHSQTDTFGSKRFESKKSCPSCGVKIYKDSKKCSLCSNRENAKVKNRPTLEVLLDEVDKFGYCAVGRKYGVSDNAIRKWINGKK